MVFSTGVVLTSCRNDSNPGIVETQGVKITVIDADENIIELSFEEGTKFNTSLFEQYQDENFDYWYLANSGTFARIKDDYVLQSGDTLMQRLVESEPEPQPEPEPEIQNFDKTNGVIDFNKPLYDETEALGYTAYDVNGKAITTEASTYSLGNYSHIISAKDGLSNISKTAWKTGLISLTDTKGVKFDNYSDLGIIPAKNWSTDWIAMCIVTDGESHIYS